MSWPKYKNIIPQNLIAIANNIPCEFPRAPRFLHKFEYFIVFRMLLVEYTGIVVFKDQFSNKVYNNFVLLLVPICLLSLMSAIEHKIF